MGGLIGLGIRDIFDASKVRKSVGIERNQDEYYTYGPGGRGGIGIGRMQTIHIREARRKAIEDEQNWVTATGGVFLLTAMGLAGYLVSFRARWKRRQALIEAEYEAARAFLRGE